MDARAFHPEDQARAEIDAKLSACGWIVQNRDEMNLAAGIGVAIREFQTATGPADYALFADGILCGAIEAKADGITLSGFSEQASGYLSGAPDYLPGGPEQRRFEYVSTGTETMFRDLANPEPRSRRVFTFHRPETFRLWLSQPETLRTRLVHMPALVTKGLRTCQIEAIEGLEKSLARDDPRALIQMTVGAGKTFTACTASYRLLTHAGIAAFCFSSIAAISVTRPRPNMPAIARPELAGCLPSFTTCKSSARPGSTTMPRSSSPPSNASIPC